MPGTPGKIETQDRGGGGWQCFEASGVQHYWVGNDAKQSAVDYAKARAKFGRGEIRVLKQDGSVESVIG